MVFLQRDIQEEQEEHKSAVAKLDSEVARLQKALLDKVCLLLYVDDHLVHF